MSNIMRMEHDEDPAKKIWKEIGKLDDIDIFNNQVLVAVYIRPNKTKGGIYLSDKTTDEDRFQGKVGMIVKMGPSAFVDPDEKWFNGVKMGLGDWIFFRPSDGWHVTVNGVLCRIVQDIDVKGKVPAPDTVW